MKLPARQKDHHLEFDAELLAKKIYSYKHTNALIVATCPRSVELASQLGEELDLPCSSAYCVAIQHPGKSNESIGSLTATEVLLHSNASDVPRSYIQHQIILLQNGLQKKNSNLSNPTFLERKSVIILRDSIERADDVLALIEQLKKTDAGEIIVVSRDIKKTALAKIEPLVTNISCLRIS